MLWKRLFDGPVEWQLVAAAMVPTLILAWIAARLAKRMVARALRGALQGTLVESSPLVRGPLRLIGIATFVMIAGVLLFPAFEVVGLKPRTGVHLQSIASWMFASGLRVILISVLAYALIRTVGLVVSRFEHDLSAGTGLDALERAKRARTLGSVITKVATALIVGIAVLMVLRELHLDIAPVLTGAGIVGLAVGFGAQTLVRDIISGFFLILENQVRVGDVVAINGIGGLVEAINLRTTILRDEEGTVHVVPNGAITTLANRSMHFSFYVVNLPLAYGEDTDRATGILRAVADDLQQDDAYRPFILEPLEVIGVDAFEETAVRLKVRIKTAPQKQWFVGREFRRRLNKALREQGVQMFSPQRTMAVSTPPEPTPSSSVPGTPARS
jgi:small conductance mechanosensitive channel